MVYGNVWRWVWSYLHISAAAILLSLCPSCHTLLVLIRTGSGLQSKFLLGIKYHRYNWARVRVNCHMKTHTFLAQMFEVYVHFNTGLSWSCCDNSFADDTLCVCWFVWLVITQRMRMIGYSYFTLMWCLSRGHIYLTLLWQNWGRTSSHFICLNLYIGEA